ncbi:GNAT family N-acetyltransferase [[Pseudomonas] carboxydohydrogena]|uniref:GNAT family N-acetyltransferase n=1 Tax=Afipia carboxydohydrogena TaxID=290 RepID=A0ABY8BM34_AFICR|nr:GNAT family N-acetyltransferase [[Pseudomonas] carboxydohydrogena]WEF51054.1 GNAT family N-acetyltransferase [[Pseudomonas] carboxydohydrogena]
MDLSVDFFDPRNEEEWDELALRSTSGTFLHTRRFLNYHGARFVDASICIRNGSKLLGVFPAAQEKTISGTVVSHPGITYGGIVHDGSLRGEWMIRALQQSLLLFSRRGFDKLHYKVVPRIYHRSPAEDDLYALFRLKARLFRCDLSVALNLANRQPMASRRKRSLKKAQSFGIEIHDAPSCAKELWPVLEENLEQKHGATPVHTLSEISLLHDLFPESVRFLTAHYEGRVVAGLVLFITRNATHSQYIASSALGQQLNALDLLFDRAIEEAMERQHSYFNFGISTERAGQVLNEGLFQFKAEFGGGGVVHEFYEVDTISSEMTGERHD